MEEIDVTWSVGDLSAAIKGVLQAGMPQDIWVKGEITGHFVSAKGHTYLTLIEKGASSNRFAEQISVMMWADQREQLEQSGELPLQVGLEVRICGRVGYYAAQSKAQLTMTNIDVNFTLGDLAAQRDALVVALSAEGLLEANKRHSVPLVPLRIGLLTSVGSAAHNDFVDQLAQSGYAFDIKLCDSRVQGAEAITGLISGLDALQRGHQAACAGDPGHEGAVGSLDAIVVIRGGGSSTDLLAFDDENVARAVAGCSLPVIVGIGHEIDNPVVDLVAHTACITPTAAAGWLVERVEAFDSFLAGSAQALRDRTGRATSDARLSLQSLSHSLSARSTAQLTSARQSLTAAAVGVRTGTAGLFTKSRAGLQAAAASLGRSPSLIAAARKDVASAAALVNSHDPKRVLERGFSVTRSADGSVVRTLPVAGDEVNTTTRAGSFVSTVSSTQQTSDA